MQLNLLLPFIAVFFGAGIVLYFRPKTPLGMKLILAFSGSFLLSIIVIDMLPHIFENPNNNPGIWIMVGIVFQILLELFSKGAEHGHTHHTNSNKLPWVLIFSLCIHAFMEGMPLTQQPELLIGIIVHKIPIGMVITLLLWETQTPKYQKIIALFTFAIMTPLGGFVKENVLALEAITTTINAVVVGVLLHIATTILFESSAGHVFNIRKFIAILTGILIAAIL
ncbi:MAG: ZIP family metal transporter [Flavobacteriaceae bacterium]|nr:ZIP family metal transporter [Flavobacteriaceae bacterium]